MDQENSEAEVKASIAEQANRMLESRAHTFVITPATFAAEIWRDPETDTKDAGEIFGRCVSAAAIRLLLDWATNDFAMSLPEFISGMFLGKAWDQTTPPWKLIPEAKDRLTAESLGLDHLYPRKMP